MPQLGRSYELALVAELSPPVMSGRALRSRKLSVLNATSGHTFQSGGSSGTVEGALSSAIDLQHLQGNIRRLSVCQANKLAASSLI